MISGIIENALVFFKMSTDLPENTIEQNIVDASPSLQEETHAATKLGEVANIGIMDQASIEIVNMGNNDHYMLMVNATATPKTIESELLVQTWISQSNIVETG
jgi:hypothetical protein